MKKIFYIIGIIVGFISLLIALWFYVKINVICSAKNGIMYDGFGYEYVNREPYSPYTIWIYVFGFFGMGVIGSFRKKLIRLRDSKKGD